MTSPIRAMNPAHRLHHVAFAVEDGNITSVWRTVWLRPDAASSSGRPALGTPKSTTGFRTNSFAYAFDPSGDRNEFSSGMNEYPDDASLIEQIRPEQIPEVMNGYGLSIP